MKLKRTYFLTTLILGVSIRAFTTAQEATAEEDITIDNNSTQGALGMKLDSVKTNIGISEKHREEIAKILNTILANQWVLYTKTINYHWNVHGIVFHDFHALFKEQYEQLLDISDEVAERIRKLGVFTHATLTEFSKVATIKEEPGVFPSALQMIKNLLADHEFIIRLIRSDLQKIADQYGDLGTNNFLTEIMERHEKIAWMLRATAAK